MSRSICSITAYSKGDLHAGISPTYIVAVINLDENSRTNEELAAISKGFADWAALIIGEISRTEFEYSHDMGDKYEADV